MLLLIVLILSGCAAQQSNITRPDWTTTANAVQAERTPIKEGRKLPTLCPINAQTGAWSADCWLTLEAYEIIAEGNTAIASLNASALHKTEGAVDTLLESGRLEQQLTEFYEQLLQEERQGRFIDGLINKSVIGLILIGVSL